MGLFNTVMFRCPVCGGNVEVQSKDGPDECATYHSLDETPEEVLMALNGVDVYCGSCRCALTIRSPVSCWVESQVGRGSGR